LHAAGLDQPVVFMAEAYWDLEWGLQQQGFGYCCDKRLYDRLDRDSAENVRLHLKDVFSGSTYTRDPTETVEPALFVDLPAWGFHVFTLRAQGETA
jgi:hypothetical protein